MSVGRQDVFLGITGALFFGVVAPILATVAPLLPLVFFAYLGAYGTPSLLFLAPYAFGGVPAVVAGFAYVTIGSLLLQTGRLSRKRMRAFASTLCALLFVIWFVSLGLVLHPETASLQSLLTLLVVAGLFSGFAAVGGYLTALVFQRFVTRVGLWSDTVFVRGDMGDASSR